MELNKKYNIKVEILGKLLLYSNSKVVSINDSFVTFIDSHTGKPISYNKNVIVFYEEVRG